MQTLSPTPKPAAQSLTVRSGIATSISGIVATVAIWSQDPATYQKAAGCLNSFGLNAGADWALKISAALPMILGFVTVYGRISARRPLYTPKGVPGPNKPTPYA